jgi:hypothetical protein
MSLIPYRTDIELAFELTDYDELGYQDIPYMLRQQIESRTLMFKRREPTELEVWETNKDAKEHRHINNERTLDDFKDTYQRGKHFNLFA